MDETFIDMTLGWNSLAADLLYSCMEDGVPSRELAYYERRIRENGGTALDQACGTGRHVFTLLQRGLRVHGADVSADAIRYARMEAAERRLDTTFFLQRMEDCDLPQRYGTIYVANGTFQIIVDRKLALATLGRFLSHLLPGGELLVELSVPEEAVSGKPCNDAGHPIVWEPTLRRKGGGAIRTTLWNESVDLSGQTMISVRRNELLVDGRVVRSEKGSHPMTWYFKREFLQMLEQAGFTNLRTCADFTDESASDAIACVVYSGRRPCGSFR
jgi:SAM-dependent methyltransferase